MRRQQRFQHVAALGQWQRAQVPAIEVKEIEGIESGVIQWRRRLRSINPVMGGSPGT